MKNAFKIAISLPREDFDRMEKTRKKLGFGRSAIIDRAIRFWLDKIEQEDSIKRYEQGYKKHPEDIQEIKAWEKEYANAFKEEELE